MLKRLKKMRKEKDISQNKLAEAIGATQQSINKYENHNIEPDIAMLKRMADFFDTSVDYIIGYTQVRKKLNVGKNFKLSDEEARLINIFDQLPKPLQKKVIELLEEMQKNIKF